MIHLRKIVESLFDENTCIHCGNLVDENLRKWFSDKWVNIGKKKKGGGHPRSEEHTSELQSQSTISYAVFCLKTKQLVEMLKK